MQFKEKAALRDTLVASISSDELRDLAFDVGLDYDALPGDTLQSKAHELILYMERSGRVDQIVDWLRKHRPDIETDHLVNDTGSAPPPTPAPPAPPPARHETQAPRRSAWRYVDLDIHVDTASEGGYIVRASGSDGVITSYVRWDATEMALKGGLSKLRSPTVSPATLQRLGAMLFDFLFAEEVADLYQKTLRRADRNLDAVRLRLFIAPLELSRLPWECLYDPRLASFLAVRGRFALTHTVDVSHPGVAPADTDVWRVLLLLSSPQNVPPLNLDREQALIERALSAPEAGGRFAVDVLTNPTLAMVGEALQQQAYHIVHYTGHGVLSEKDTTVLGMAVHADRPYLVLSDAAGQAALVDDTSLAQLLASAASVRLVFLNTQAGPGEALLRAGQLEAVVSMRYPITDQAASVFAREFYQGIADQLPMEMVFTQARIALYQELGAASRDWVSPVLTTRGE